MESTLLNKVINGLEHCIKDEYDSCPYKIEGCDYYDTRCINNLMTDSLYLHTGRILKAGYLVDWDTPHEI